MNTSAVNEFLAQMNNSGENGVFVIDATNRPHAIDPAVLRSGRLDKHIYLPPPDSNARESLFELYLNKRPIELGLQYDVLSNMTENYVSSDIKFICDEAARNELKSNSKISFEILSSVIENRKSSISTKDLANYELIRKRFEGGGSSGNNERTRIGF